VNSGECTHVPTIYPPSADAMEKSLGDNLSRVSSISSLMLTPVEEKVLENKKQKDSQFPHHFRCGD